MDSNKPWLRTESTINSYVPAMSAPPVPWSNGSPSPQFSPSYYPNQWSGINYGPNSSNHGGIYAISSGLGQVASTIELFNNFISLSMMTSRNIFEHYQQLKGNLLSLLRFILDTIRRAGQVARQQASLAKLAVLLLAIVSWLMVTGARTNLGITQKAIVVFPIESSHPDVLQVNVGEQVAVDPIPGCSEWFYAKTLDGLKMGLVPASHVKASLL